MQQTSAVCYKIVSPRLAASKEIGRLMAAECGATHLKNSKLQFIFPAPNTHHHPFSYPSLDVAIPLLIFLGNCASSMLSLLSKRKSLRRQCARTSAPMLMSQIR